MFTGRLPKVRDLRLEEKKGNVYHRVRQCKVPFEQAAELKSTKVIK